MKKKYILIIFTLLLISSSCLAQFYSGGHDSLLFDGANEIIYIPINRTGDCYVRVIYANGSTEGTYYVTKTYEICGVWDTINTTEKGPLSPMNELKIGEEITTGDNSSLELKFYDGSFIRLGPNSKITITGNMCESQTLVHMVGKMWTNIKKLLGSQKYEVKHDAYRCNIGVRGTEFSVETTSDGVVVKVYEGSVEVYPPMIEVVSEDEAGEIEKLTKDYQAGKISLEEFVQKTKDISGKMSQRNEEMKGKMCDAGYMIKFTDKVSDPVPIESTGPEWFDDANFKK